MARLVINPGSPTAWEIQLKPGINTLGRGPANDIKLTDPSVSNCHCEILVGEGAATIKDLGSSNGTFIDRQSVRQASLRSGQRVHLGATEMMFVGDGGPVTVSATPGKPKARLMATLVTTQTAGAVVAPEPAARVPTPAPISPAAPAATPAPPARAPGRLQAGPAVAAPAACGKKPNFGLGVLGAFVGTLVGALIYFLIFNYTGLRLKLLAIGVGYLAGLGAELLGRKEGSKELGMIAAVFALCGIVGAQYLVARNWWHEAEASRAREQENAYAEAVAEARKVLAAVPTGSEQEVRIYLAKGAAEDGEKADTNSVSSEEISAFRETTLPQMRDLAAGKISKADYEKKNGLDEAKTKEEKESDEGTFKAVFLLLLLSRLNIVSLIAAGGLAFKVCSNA